MTLQVTSSSRSPWWQHISLHSYLDMLEPHTIIESTGKPLIQDSALSLRTAENYNWLKEVDYSNIGKHNEGKSAGMLLTYRRMTSI